MEVAEEYKGLPLKEHDLGMERLEQENFDLKLQINHLKMKLKDYTNQTAYSVADLCDCKEKQAETQTILSEVKSAMESLIIEKESLETLHSQASLQAERLREENERLGRDCTKLSMHIAAKQKEEEATQRALGDLKREILSVQAGLEEGEEARKKVHELQRAYSLLKEEHLKLESLSRSIEAGYKEEAAKREALQKENVRTKEIADKITHQIEGAQRYIDEQTKQIQKGEALLEESRRDKQRVLLEAEVEINRAKCVIGEREAKIKSLQKECASQTERANHMQSTVKQLESEVERERSKASELDRQIGQVSRKLQEAEAVQRTLKETQKLQEETLAGAHRDASSSAQKERQEIESQLRAYRKEKEVLESKNQEVQEELKTLRKRVHITKGSLEIAHELGIEEFTTLDDLFVHVKQELSKLQSRHANKEKELQQERASRNHKLNIFQEKLQAALSELHVCKQYLEEKKELIKSLKKYAGGSFLKKIEVSADK
ncbi:hypothetical protein NECID01_0033 [Nematocida sp. AWRm77]|nr:hypothetical protein NECID01_0033 [Nematocida sp. AWRm77]